MRLISRSEPVTSYYLYLQPQQYVFYANDFLEGLAKAAPQSIVVSCAALLRRFGQ